MYRIIRWTDESVCAEPAVTSVAVNSSLSTDAGALVSQSAQSVIDGRLMAGRDQTMRDGVNRYFDSPLLDWSHPGNRGVGDWTGNRGSLSLSSESGSEFIKGPVKCYIVSE